MNHLIILCLADADSEQTACLTTWQLLWKSSRSVHASLDVQTPAQQTCFLHCWRWTTRSRRIQERSWNTRSMTLMLLPMIRLWELFQSWEVTCDSCDAGCCAGHAEKKTGVWRAAWGAETVSWCHVCIYEVMCAHVKSCLRSWDGTLMPWLYVWIYVCSCEKSSLMSCEAKLVSCLYIRIYVYSCSRKDKKVKCSLMSEMVNWCFYAWIDVWSSSHQGTNSCLCLCVCVSVSAHIKCAFTKTTFLHTYVYILYAHLYTFVHTEKKRTFMNILSRSMSSM